MALAALAACGGEDPPTAAERVRVGLPRPGQASLVSSRALTVSLTSPTAQRVSVEARLRRGGEDAGDGERLGPAQEVGLTAGAGRRVRLPLAESGRAAASRCEPGRVDVAVRTPEGDLLGGSSSPLAPEPPTCGPFFARRSVWNAPLAANAPLDPASRTLSAELRRQVEGNFRARFGPEINVRRYGVPIVTVPRDQKRVKVTLDNPESWADGIRKSFESVPIPDDARPAAGTDKHLVVWQPETDTLWEFWVLERLRDGWHADFGGRMRGVSRNAGYFSDPGGSPPGATATSLPLVGGLITLGDLRRGRVDHALAIALPETRANWWARPAQRTDGHVDSPRAIPEGARFRIDPRLDLDELDLPPLTRMLADAAQRYGMIVRDKAGVVAFYGEDPGRTADDPWRDALEGRPAAELLRPFPWDRLQLLRMELDTWGPP